MDDFRSLRMLDAFRKLFTGLGIDYDIMRKILQSKLTMDDRRVPTIFEGGNPEKENNQFLKSLGIYALYGLILIPFILMNGNTMIQMSLVFGIIIFILMTTMISDFSTVLLDLRDRFMLNTRPIDNRTIQAAKTIHVLIYMVSITGAFVAVPVAVSLFSQGPLFALLFVGTLIFVGLFVVVATALLYLLVLKFFDGERLKDIINYVQIIMSIGIFLGYQLVGRSLEFTEAGFEYQFDWWHLFIPAFWFGAPFELLLHEDSSIPLLALSILALLVPVISLMMYVKMMPSFERNLQKLLTHSSRKKKKWRGFGELWSKILCRTKEERAIFRFAGLMMEKDREFKLKVYPGLALSLFIPYLFVVNEIRFSSMEEVFSGNAYLSIYFCNFMIPPVIQMLQYSGDYKASWIFGTAPIQQTASIYSGTLKSFIVKLYLPIFLAVSIGFTWLFSISLIPQLLIIFLAGIVQSLVTYKLIKHDRYPFSKSFKFIKEAKSAKSFLLALITGLFYGAHYIALKIPYGLPIYFILLLGAVIIGWVLIFPRTTAKPLGR
ncbi:hypothetical protein [Paenisporosarcina sp. NPDC076898]|uniref:hypothetical protein n=1 Tax=unclassified Paenisporosarcina TaxID=2642018 RepID=UPI003CFD662D